MDKLPLLLEPEELAQHLPLTANIVVIEQCSLETYQAGHIPGAFWVDFKSLQATVAPYGELPEAANLSTLLGSMGITPDTHIVCSDGEGGGWAGRLIWILDSIGHSSYSLLNGGFTAWQAASLPITQEIPALVAANYPVEYNSEASLTQAQILERLGQADFAIWDARSAAEFSGEKAVSARGGHIPGAVHYEWTQAMDTERALRLRPLATIRQELEELGITADKLVVTHCQTHHRSGLTYAVGKILGLNIKGYGGSWSQWGNQADTPVATLI